MADQTAADQKEIETRYRSYCDACQSGHLERLTDFWALLAMFTVEFPTGDTAHTIVQSGSELEKLYSQEFGHSTGVDQTIIDTREVKFYGANSATIETSLRHLVKEKLHDQQFAVYGCRKVDGSWVFISHISKVKGPE